QNRRGEPSTRSISILLSHGARDSTADTVALGLCAVERWGCYSPCLSFPSQEVEMLRSHSSGPTGLSRRCIEDEAHAGQPRLGFVEFRDIEGDGGEAQIAHHVKC